MVEPDVVDRGVGLVELEQRLPPRHVPQLQLLVQARDGQHRSVGAERDRAHRLAHRQLPHGAEIGHAPQPHHPVPAGRQHRAVR